MSVNELIKKNSERWAKAKLNRNFADVAKRLVASKDRYKAVEKQTGVPWFVIAVIHERESGQKWNKSLAQGDPWNQVSTHIPRGRGPFESWEEAAYDALVNCGPHAANWKDWTSGGTLTLLERYNGLGYFNKGIPSPYVWSGTDQYVSGKYVADGVFDANAVDGQLGCAGLLKQMQKLDNTIKFKDEVSSTKPKSPVGPAVGTGIITVAALWNWMKEHPIEVAAIGLATAALIYFGVNQIRKRKERKNVSIRKEVPVQGVGPSEGSIPPA
jgi:lysozyme family protein